MIKTAIFDLGNVLLNFKHELICERIAGYSGYSCDAVYRMGFHSEEFHLYDTGKITSEEFFRWALERFKIDISYEMFQYMWSDIFSPNKSMELVLSDLKGKGHQLILLSNTNELHFDFITDHFDIIKMFDDLVLSYRVGYSKPHEEIYKEALGRTRATAEECVYIDDIEEYCLSGASFGINSILYRSTDQLIQELRGLGITVPPCSSRDD